MLLVYTYLQSFYYLSVKSDALNPTLSIETLRPNFRYYLIFPNWAIFESHFSRYYILRLRVSNEHNSGMKLGMWTLSIPLCRRCSALSLGTLITKILVCSNSLVFPAVTYDNNIIIIIIMHCNISLFWFLYNHVTSRGFAL